MIQEILFRLVNIIYLLFLVVKQNIFPWGIFVLCLFALTIVGFLVIEAKVLDNKKLGIIATMFVASGLLLMPFGFFTTYIVLKYMHHLWGMIVIPWGALLLSFGVGLFENLEVKKEKLNG